MQTSHVFLCTKEDCLAKNGEFCRLTEIDGVTYGTCKVRAPNDDVQITCPPARSDIGRT